MLAKSSGLVSKHRRERDGRSEARIEICLALHAPLGDLIKLPAHTGHAQDDRTGVNLLVTGLAKRQEIGERVLAPTLPVDDMMGFQTAVAFAAVLTNIAVAHQASDPQVFIQAGWVLILAAP